MTEGELISSIISENKKLALILRVLQTLVIVEALPKAIPLSNWLMYLVDKDSFSANYKKIKKITKTLANYKKLY